MFFFLQDYTLSRTKKILLNPKQSKHFIKPHLSRRDKCYCTFVIIIIFTWTVHCMFLKCLH